MNGIGSRHPAWCHRASSRWTLRRRRTGPALRGRSGPGRSLSGGSICPVLSGRQRSGSTRTRLIEWRPRCWPEKRTRGVGKRGDSRVIVVVGAGDPVGCPHLTSAYKHNADLVGVVWRHLVQNLHGTVDHLPQRVQRRGKKRIKISKSNTAEEIPGPRDQLACVLGRSSGLLASFPKKGEW